jgi:hypothetical protein
LSEPYIKKEEEGTRKKELFVGTNKQLKLLNYKVFLNSDSSFFLWISRSHNVMSSDFVISEEKLETCYLRIRRLSPLSGLVIKNN